MRQTTPSTEGKTIGAVETAFDIVELVAENGEMTPREIAEALDYARSTVHYYLKTLEKHRFLVRTEAGYRIGFRFLDYGNVAIRDHPLTGLVDKEVAALAQETETTALFAVHQQGRSVFLAQSSPAETTGAAHYLGIERHLPETAFGKALLAHLPAETLAAVLEGHDADGDAAADRDALSEELATIRDEGFAHGSGVGDEGVRSIAVPIVRDRDREVVGAMGIVGRDEAIADPGSHIKAQRFAEKPVTIVKRYAQVLRNKVA